MAASLDIEIGFGSSLREWRLFRRLSQLELSLRANISQRHLSWLETGRSQPSRQMVLQLSETLDIPLRERNQLLNAAGFVSIYRERKLDEEQMGAVRGALRKMLDQQQPFPSLVVDREWNILMSNPCAKALLGAVIDDSRWDEIGGGERRNIALLTLHPRGLRPLIENWSEVAHSFVQRLRRDRDRTADPELRAHLAALIELGEDPPALRPVPSSQMLPMLSLDLRLGDQMLRLFSVISTFGTAQDVTADELRIESFFPLDSASDALLRQFSSV